MSVHKNALEELRRISEMCHDMLCKINEGIATDCDVISLVFSIREDAAREYNKGVVSLGIHNSYDLIAEMNNKER